MLESIIFAIFSPLYSPTPTVIATSCYTVSYTTVTSQCFLHYRRIVISRSWSETSLVNVVPRHAFLLNSNLIIHHYYTYVNAFTFVQLSVFEFASIYLALVRSH